MNSLEKYFQPFRENTVGYHQTFISPYGEKRIIYADWIASGRLYFPIEKTILEKFGPFVGKHSFRIECYRNNDDECISSCS